MLVRIANAQIAEHYIHAPPNLEVSWPLDNHVDASRVASGGRALSRKPTHSHHLDQPVKVSQQRIHQASCCSSVSIRDDRRSRRCNVPLLPFVARRVRQLRQCRIRINDARVCSKSWRHQLWTSRRFRPLNTGPPLIRLAGTF